ncbi:MAG: type II toxin-antitoxin system VapC family toxin [Chloroflexota bacterium]|nr:type II toxin-antitoxin system VapC family toxin [Chloroflexota bacterium]
MRGYVLDASALLALLNEEPGSEQVADFIAVGAVMSTVNFAEVVTKLREADVTEEIIHEALDPLGIIMLNFDTALAYEVGLLRPLTKQTGLSLGDRACLALAKHLQLPAITSDPVWGNLSLNIKIQVIQ